MGEGAHHHQRWDRCDVDEVRFAFFLVPRYEVLCFQDLLVYSHVACRLAPGVRRLESMEEFTRKILIHPGYQPVKGGNPLSFNDRERNADNQDFVDRFIAGAMIRWKRGAGNTWGLKWH